MQFKLPPANRIIAFAGPYISLAAGAVASWLVVNVQVLGSLGLGQDKLSHGIAYGVTAALGAGLPHLGMQKWLDGHQQYVGHLFNVINVLDPGVQRQVAAALPLFEGDALKALEHVLTVPQEQARQAALGEIKFSSAIDTSGDIERPNSLVDVAAPFLDELPAPGSLGDDSVHGPPPPATAAVPAQPVAAGGGEQ